MADDHPWVSLPPEEFEEFARAFVAARRAQLSAANFDPNIEHPVHLGKAAPEETIRVSTGRANVRNAVGEE